QLCHKTRFAAPCSVPTLQPDLNRFRPAVFARETNCPRSDCDSSPVSGGPSGSIEDRFALFAAPTTTQPPDPKQVKTNIYRHSPVVPPPPRPVPLLGSATRCTILASSRKLPNQRTT